MQIITLLLFTFISCLPQIALETALLNFANGKVRVQAIKCIKDSCQEMKEASNKNFLEFSNIIAQKSNNGGGGSGSPTRRKILKLQ